MWKVSALHKSLPPLSFRIRLLLSSLIPKLSSCTHMAGRPSRAIPIPKPQSSRRYGQPSFPGPGVDSLAQPHEWPSFASRPQRSDLTGPSPFVPFADEPEPQPSAGPSRDGTSASSALYPVPPFADPRNRPSSRICTSCRRAYYPQDASHHTICPKCRDKRGGAPLVRPRSTSLLASDYIPAWHDRARPLPTEDYRGHDIPYPIPPRPPRGGGMPAPVPPAHQSQASRTHVPPPGTRMPAHPPIEQYHSPARMAQRAVRDRQNARPPPADPYGSPQAHVERSRSSRPDWGQ
ncbi:hypothetical protein BD413DRAFT_7890 [Trametes elegans]|nr:hypothetical protein BD413DRAFT_7890 [Trametes elegans]